MTEYVIDLILFSAFVIGLTAIMGVLTNGIGEKLFGGKNKRFFVEKSASIQSGWNKVGGRSD
ncbi:hypothetical protein [Falsibacillus pallidus]|uniref:Uncharacterized protein n=1 Tax=Falsibacillus pallidus TaxID=493781 RepID=A0A370GVQ9_9BACI|nr:hypothetical protein [Falsibacillus pallidus]RDI47765.1 hypothetical protein DFR59_101429 [Falsibacillus pallidus]